MRSASYPFRALALVSVPLFGLVELGHVPVASAESSSPSPEIQRVADPEEDRGPGDGVYDRFDGDMSFRAGLGAELAFDEFSPRPLLLVGLSAYQTLGVYSAFRLGVVESDPLQSGFSFGGSLSPLFLLRWQRNAASGRAFADLTVDSITLHFGAHLDQPKGASFASETGFEGGLDMGIPLALRASGPWLRTRVNVLTGNEGVDATMWIYFAWDAFFQAGILPVD